VLVKIWRSGDPEMRKRVADVFLKQSRRRRVLQGCFVRCDRTKSDRENESSGGGAGCGQGWFEWVKMDPL
jgi:hypothetical protein